MDVDQQQKGKNELKAWGQIKYLLQIELWAVKPVALRRGVREPAVVLLSDCPEQRGVGGSEPFGRLIEISWLVISARHWHLSTSPCVKMRMAFLCSRRATTMQLGRPWIFALIWWPYCKISSKHSPVRRVSAEMLAHALPRSSFQSSPFKCWTANEVIPTSVNLDVSSSFSDYKNMCLAHAF